MKTFDFILIIILIILFLLYEIQQLIMVVVWLYTLRGHKFMEIFIHTCREDGWWGTAIHCDMEYYLGPYRV